MRHFLFRVILIIVSFGRGTADDILSNVICTAQNMTLEFAPNSNFFNATHAKGLAVVVPQGWPIDGSVPTGCGGVLGPLDSSLEVEFTACNATVYDIIGPSGEIEDYFVLQTFVGYPLVVNHPQFTFAAYCDFPAVYINNQTGVTVENPWDPNGGSHGGTVTPGLKIAVLKDDGSEVHQAELGDKLSLNVMMVDNTNYLAILPDSCWFGSDPNPSVLGQAKIPFIDSGCPLGALPNVLGAPVKMNQSYYHVPFFAFKFSQNLVFVYVHCRITLCLNASACDKSCWSTKFSQELTGTGFLSYTPQLKPDPGLVPVTHTLEIITRNPTTTTQFLTPPPTTEEKTAVKDTETCISTTLLYVLYALVGLFAAAFLVVLCFICIVLVIRPRKKVVHDHVTPQAPVIIQQPREDMKTSQTLYHPATFAVPRAWVEKSAAQNLHGNIEFQ